MITLSNNTEPQLSNQSSKVTVFKPSKRMDSENCYHLRQKIMAIAAMRPAILVIDMKEVLFIDSNGLGLLISILKAMRAFGGRLILASLNEQAEMLLDLTSTKNLFEVSDKYSKLTNV